MASVSIYLNFQGNCEEAFNCYKAVFGTEFSSPLMRLGEVPQDPNGPQFTEQELNGVMHVALPITGGTVIMGTDMVESMGHKLVIGNNTTINLTLDTREEADRLHAALSAGGSQTAPMTDQFWGYWGTCLDRFGVRWMFNGPLKG